MAVNFKSLHAQIKASVAGRSFKYVEAGQWYDENVGKIPKALLGQSFTIRFGAISTPSREYSSAHWADIDIIIEFALLTLHDEYLDSLDSIMTEIKLLYALELSTAKIVINPSDGKDHWDEPEYISDGENQIVLIRFHWPATVQLQD